MSHLASYSRSLLPGLVETIYLFNQRGKNIFFHVQFYLRPWIMPWFIELSLMINLTVMTEELQFCGKMLVISHVSVRKCIFPVTYHIYNFLEKLIPKPSSIFTHLYWSTFLIYVIPVTLLYSPFLLWDEANQCKLPSWHSKRNWSSEQLKNLKKFKEFPGDCFSFHFNISVTFQ